ncbi:hypothetical protein [Couchioplanes caeruleus]|uniref:Uncharacterized protein n=2 Tax=Couchioplanes caeruleus TaxID=56438 RepID=A0A1K0G9F7_9ACTN|nr:hypothetical protein [Couchioplanes caeruleus]OJF13874.1 hypothetical protein BG844_12800 [Couchioplanes caeruleus subsp. caeruleus]ROP30702.1 hypothetical protein EDD30_3563 [Couchioplanes caeruleus]
MDRLGQLFDTAGPLLRRVDALLDVGGAPAEHGVWAQLRRVRLLSGDAVQAVAALRPADLGDAAPELRADARTYAALAASLPVPKEWSGAAAEAYERARRRTAAHLSGDADSLGDRLRASADLADDLVDWMRTSREALAVALAEVLGSSEAITLSADTVDIPSPAQIAAAADVAETILRTVADAYDRAADLLHTSSALAEPLAPAR